MIYTVYIITNNINGKHYIGAHQTNKIDDNYMGSGKLIKRAIAKYGVENFTKQILATFDAEDQMFDEEKNLISKLNPEYNIHEGGNGGWYHLNHGKLKHLNKRFNKEWQRKISPFTKKNFDRVQWVETYRDDFSRGGQKTKVLQIGIHDPQKRGLNGFKGKKHTEETKIKIGKANSLNQKGSKNSQFGTVWITDGVLNKKIKTHDTVPNGWRRGRKIMDSKSRRSRARLLNDEYREV